MPDEMIAATKHATSGNGTMVIVGGGIRDEKTARKKVKSGADIIVTGTIAENDTDAFGKIIKAVKKG